MKKLFSFFLALAASVGMLHAESGTCGNNLTWNLSNGVLTISGTGDMKNYSDYSNAPWYYKFRESIKQIVIENSVTSIGNYAFYGCTGPTSVTIGNSVTTIGYSAFQGCTGLTSVSIPNSVTTIGLEAFYGCTGLTSVTIGNSVTAIGSQAFYGCIGLTSVTIGDSVTAIGSQAFYGCTGLTSITIPNSVTSIGGGAFYGCTGLTSITIPSSVTSIGTSPFSECTSLTSVTLNSNAIAGKTYSYDNNLNNLFGSQVTTYVIGNDVTIVGDYAFYGGTNLTSVTPGNSIASIKQYAFKGCSSLTSVSIPNSVTTIGREAFSDCSGLTSVTIGKSVTSIGSFAFAGCSNLTSIAIPNSVTSIKNYAFQSCPGLRKIVVESENTKYDSRNNCNAIIETGTNTLIAGCQYSTIPNSVTSIGVHAFAGCSSLTDIEIPNSVTSIGDGAFGSCTSLKSIDIPNGITSIEKYTFQYCSSLTSITIPNNVTSVEDHAFKGCSSLTSVVIGNNVTKIGWETFYKCSSLANLTIGSNVTSIDKDAFAGCSNITTVTLHSSSIVGKTYDYGANFKYLFGSHVTEYIIGDEVTSIGIQVFQYCSNLKSVTIGNNVTCIGNRAFQNCDSLTSVIIGKSVTSIDECAFGGCHSLKTVFNYCTTPPVLDWCSFSNSTHCTIYVPINSIDVYKTTDGWKELIIKGMVDVETMTKAITNATSYYNIISTDYPEIANNLLTAIQAAQKEADNGCTDIEESATAYDELMKALQAAEQAVAEANLATNISLFEEYKTNRSNSCASLALENDSETCQQLIATAQAAIAALKYDENKTLEENKAVVDDIVTKLKTDLEAQREKEAQLAKDKTAFEEYKTNGINTCATLTAEDDSDACRQLITEAQAAIAALTYNENKTLDENKAAVDAIITKLASDLEAQREKERKDGVDDVISNEENRYFKKIIDNGNLYLLRNGKTYTVQGQEVK